MAETKKLVQIKLHPGAYNELDELKKSTGYTMTDIIKYAVSLFRWVISKQKNGYAIYAIPKEKGKEVPGEKIELLVPLS